MIALRWLWAWRLPRPTLPTHEARGSHLDLYPDLFEAFRLWAASSGHHDAVGVGPANTEFGRETGAKV